VVTSRFRPIENGWIAWLTGLSGAGKTTIARRTAEILSVGGAGGIELIDGDVLRRELGGRLGFDKTSRDINVAVAGFVARILAERRRPVIVSLISPYDEARREQRRRTEEVGIGFRLVHVTAPLEVLRERDTKGLYGQSDRGQVMMLTGVSDRYEVPSDADLVIDTRHDDVTFSAGKLVDLLVSAEMVEADVQDFAI
jgi:adenylyl-sulfate kinase